ncbi:MAG: MarR family transcriptional regulator [Burkholderiales bacterium 66-5]|nr:MAG: MarR family transcriptional regulator [Burkholderiales bacterium 66-5]
MAPVDMEARAHAGHPEELRLWLRMLTCTQLIERDLRSHLREQFDTTLPRFDLMAQLERKPEGLRMSELSKRMMVTGGNVTGVTDQLEKEGLVARVTDEDDRRAFRVQLTAKGRQEFRAMAQAHEEWVVTALGGLAPEEIRALHQLLGKVKRHYLELETQ